MSNETKTRDLVGDLSVNERNALKAARTSERGLVLPAYRDGGSLHLLLERRGLARGGILTALGRAARKVIEAEAG